MQSELINEGLTLMLAGMGTVFVFLTLLVIAMTVMSRIVITLSPVSASESDDEVAAIAAAIQKHRNR